VVSLRLYPEDAHRVIARVRVDSTAPVRSDTRARLVPAGITGLSMIRLTSGDDPGSTALVSANGSVPQIVAAPSPLSRLLADGEDAITNVNDLMVQARALFSHDNVASIGRTLDNLEQATAALAAQRDDMGVALRQITQAGREASATLAEATRVLGTTNRLVGVQGTQTLDSARDAMQAFERAMGTVDRLLAENREPLDAGMRGLAEIGPAVAELRSTLGSVRAITRQLEDRPADYLLGLEPTKEFTP
jgi:phospholipid/cholesterol/gamma-HCH transport system substrate-binding protein